ncbi:MAG: hypothetical protein AB3X41_05410, partial [Leptothrix ochracea]
MKRVIHRICAVAVAALGMTLGSAVFAADLSKTVSPKEHPDAVCTKCHDESEAKPLLSIYQTKHGVRADARTPSCQSCHGRS